MDGRLGLLFHCIKNWNLPAGTSPSNGSTSPMTSRYRDHTISDGRDYGLLGGVSSANAS
jgi:hypothetical protein